MIPSGSAARPSVVERSAWQCDRIDRDRIDRGADRGAVIVHGLWMDDERLQHDNFRGNTELDLRCTNYV